MKKVFTMGAYTPHQLLTLGTEKFYKLITDEFQELNNDYTQKVIHANLEYVVKKVDYDEFVEIRVEVEETRKVKEQ